MPLKAPFLDNSCQLYKIKSSIHKKTVTEYRQADLIIQFWWGLTGLVVVASVLICEKFIRYNIWEATDGIDFIYEVLAAWKKIC